MTAPQTPVATQPAVQTARKRSKYGNQKVSLDGHTFDSKAEATRYLLLSILQRDGAIADLELHPSFRIEVNGVLVCRYVADFAYVHNGEMVIEDVKGVKTAAYQIKKKLMRAIHGIDVQEVKA